LRPSRVLRIAVAVGLTAIILWHADPRAVVRTAAGADPWWVLAAVLLVFADRALMAWRWMDLLCALTPGSRPPFMAVLRTFFVSTFVGSFLPSIGGDAYRAYSLSRHDVRLSESAASVLMDRVLGVLAIAFIGALAAVMNPRAGLGQAIVVPLACAAAGCAVVAAAVFSDRAAALAQRVAAWLPWPTAQRAGISLTEAMRRYSNHHVELVRVLLASAGVQAIRVVQGYCLGRALAIDVPLGTYFVLIPVVLLVMLLPITVSGLGTSQVAFQYLFGQSGVPAPQAVALSILFVALGVVGNLPGSLLYALDADGPRGQAQHLPRDDNAPPRERRR
jgi:glycosyltransferase 2 family protein